MGVAFDPDWSQIVCGRLGTVFESADAGFIRSLPKRSQAGTVDDMLWEADPKRFAERYPDSGIVESYGPQWPPHCIDYWIYVDVESRRATLSTEGMVAEPSEIELSGNGVQDANRLGMALDQILGTDP